MNKIGVQDNSQISIYFQSRIIAWLILAVTLALTAAAWVTLNNQVLERAHDRFVFQVDDLENAIVKRMRAYETGLRGGVGLFQASTQVTRNDWRRFVDNFEIEKQFPGIQGIGFSKWIEPSQKQAFEDAVRAEGFDDFEIKPAGPRDAYSSILYLEPFDWRNRRAFGYDMYSNPVRREAMDKARNSGKTVISGKVTLVQETNEDVQAGFLMYIPLYDDSNAPENLAPSLKKLRGWVYSPFRMKDLMTGILDSEKTDLHYQVFDGHRIQPDNLLYDTEGHSLEGTNIAAKHHEIAKAGFSTTRVISLAGRQWTVFVYTYPAYLDAFDNDLPTIVAIGGVIIDFLLFAVILSLSTQRQRAQRRADHMTVELRQQLQDTKEAQRHVEDQAAELVSLAEREAELRDKAEVATHAKSNFLSTMSHEIRTPLNGVLGLAQLLRDSDLNPDQTIKVNTILSSGQTLLSILNDILDMSKIEAGSLELENKAFSLSELISTITSPFQSLADDKQLELGVYNQTPANLIIKGDPVRLRQILWNLLSNAIKFTDTGHVNLTIEFADGHLGMLPHQSGKQDQLLRFTLTDTGSGIAAERIDAIFDAFTQEDASITRTHGGTGLGLSIVKRLATLMGGTISAESKPGQGTTFCVVLPFGSAEEEETETPALQKTDDLAPENRSLNVLLAEDNAVNAMIAKAFLEKFGHSVRHVENGRLAVEVAQDGWPDIILMDIHMPEMDGIHATKAILAIESLKNLPIIGLTAEAFVERHALFKQAGMVDVLTKPFTEIQLAAILAAHRPTAPLHKPSAAKEPPAGSASANTADCSPEVAVGTPVPQAINSQAGDQAQLATLQEKLPAEIISKLLTEAQITLEKRLLELQQGVKDGNSKVIAEAAHAIKGASGSMFAIQIAKLAAEIEEKSHSIEVVKELMPDFEVAAKEAIEWWRFQGDNGF